MIEVLPLKDKELLQKLNKKEHTNAVCAYCSYLDNQIDGYILYSMGQTATIYAICALDIQTFDCLVRAVLSAALNFGVEYAFFSENLDFDTLKKLNIVDKSKTVIINSLFNKCNGCKECK